MIEKSTNISKQSYRSIFLATSLFGGVQGFQILISVVKTKILAVLLGTGGIGILGLYSSALEMINNLTSLGLQQSAVREVTEANTNNDKKLIRRNVSIVRTLVFFTGILGIAISIFGSPLWSKLSFGNYDYILPFCLLSISAVIDKLSSGERVVLQGLRNYNGLAKASVYGSLWGLLLSIPVYYFYGIRGLVPTLIINSVMIYLATYYYSKKNNVKNIHLSLCEAFIQGKTMLKMGVAMSLTSIFGSLIVYILRSIIRSYGSVEDVGIYTAGYTLMFTYTSLIFSAMSTDFYPRLASVNKDNNACCEIANQQAEIGIIILVPLLVIINSFVDYVLTILYTSEFMVARLFVIYGSLGILFKMASWSISYLFVAKAESKIFAINETIANFNVLIFNIFGYMLWGMIGLGISTTVTFVLYTIQVWFVAKKKYNFYFSKSFKHTFLVSVIFVLVSMAVNLFCYGSMRLILGLFIVVISIIYAYFELNNRVQFRKTIKK